MNLHFLSPPYLLGILGIAIPIAVHLLTRKQVKRIKFSALQLLKQTQNRSIKKSTPNQLLLLAVRCLGIVALSLALSNPELSVGDSATGIFSETASYVFILDNSYSMAAKHNNKTNLLQESEARLAEILAALGGDSEYSLVTAAKPARILHEWTNDPGPLSKLIEYTQATYQTTDIGHAVSEAFRLLSKSSKSKKRIIILTDMDKNGWNRDDFPKSSENAGDTLIRIVDFSRLRGQPNRAGVTSVSVTRELLSNSRILRITATIANLLPSQPLHKLPVSLWVDGKRRSESFLDLPPNGTAKKEFSFPYESDEPVAGYVEIENDNLEPDDRRYFSLQPDRKIRVLIVDGDPKTVGYQSESFYLERALNPFSSAAAEIEPAIVTLTELPRHELSQYAMVMLCNVRELPAGYETTLEKFVHGGGGLFISLGDQVDAKYYNERLGGILPVRLIAINRTSRDSEPFHLLDIPEKHPVMEIFDARTIHEMKSIRFNEIYGVETREAGRDLPVLMRFSNGLPALIESTLGKGHVVIYTSSIDRDWNSFPIQPTFLPWIQRWVKHTARRLDTIAQRDLLVGEPFSLQEYDGASAWARTPSGKIHKLDKDAVTQKFATGQTLQPGNYYLFGLRPARQQALPPQDNAPASIPPGADPLGIFTVNIDTRESTPERISADEAREILPGFNVEFADTLAAQGADRLRDTFSFNTPLLLGMLALLCIEGFMIRRE